MSIKDNILKVQEHIPNDVELIAVSKTRTVEEIQQAYDTGMRNFGENKVQEIMNKVDVLPKDIKWHLIGHLQRNKVKYIVGKVHLIHSLDSIRLLNEIEKQYKKNDEVANVLIEVNIAKDSNKTGLMLEELDQMLEQCEKCNNVKVKGLMIIAPKGTEEEIRQAFKKIKGIWEELKNKNYNNITMEILSMGMTHDYQLAISEGSNMVRVGEGIFGKRNYDKEVK